MEIRAKTEVIGIRLNFTIEEALILVDALRIARNTYLATGLQPSERPKGEFCDRVQFRIERELEG